MLTSSPNDQPVPVHPSRKRLRSTPLAVFNCCVIMLLSMLMLRGSFLNIAEWRSAQNWSATPAKILALSMQYVPTHDDDDAPKMAYRIQARYEYQFGGNRYESTRVALIDAARSDPYILVIYRDLDKHRREGQAYTCYVNPANPREAVLFRQLPLDSLGLWSLFWAFFLVGGFGFMLFHCFQMARHME